MTSTIPIATMQEFNAYLAADGWDPLPLAPMADSECESKSRSATSADDDYSDAFTEWSRKSDLWDAYQAWLADTDPEKGPEPAHEGDPGDAPEPPEGYEDVEHGSWAPFTRPAGDDIDDIPTLYREKGTEDIVAAATGNIKLWSAFAPAAYPDEGGADWVVWTANPDGTVTAGTITYRWGVDSFTPEPHGGYSVVTDFPYEETPSAFPDPPGIIPWVVDDPPVEAPCTATTREVVSFSRSASSGGSAADLSGGYPPAAFSDGGDPPANGDAAAASGWPTATNWQWSDLTEKDATTTTLGSGVSKADVLARATAKIPAEWPDPPEGAACSATTVIAWPSIGSLLTGADPEADPPVAASWPDCHAPGSPVESMGSVEVTPIRYRYSIPPLWKTWQDRKDAFDAWVLAGSDPEEPVEDPGPRRTTFRMRWQEVFFPKAWEDWKALKDAFDTATAAYEAWVAGGSVGDAPIVPDAPGPEVEPKPTVGPWKTWTWSGVQLEPFDPVWHVVEAPEVEGETRRCNVGTIAYDSKYGIKYTSHGETYVATPSEIPEPSPGMRHVSLSGDRILRRTDGRYIEIPTPP